MILISVEVKAGARRRTMDAYTRPTGQRFSGLASSRGGDHAPVSQVGVQRVEDAELLLGLKHHQLLQQLTGVRAPDRQ